MAHPDISRYKFDPKLVARIHIQTLEAVTEADFNDIKGLSDVEKRVREMVQEPLQFPEIYSVS